MVAIAAVGFDEEEPIKPTTRSVQSFKTACWELNSCLFVSRTRISIWKVTYTHLDDCVRVRVCVFVIYSHRPQRMEKSKRKKRNVKS